MKRDITKAKLIESAGPYAKIWTDFQNDNIHKFSLITIGIGETFYKLFELLRESETNFLFIDGMNQKNFHIQGFLCIEGNQQFATPDNCFFVGIIQLKEKEEQVILTARQLEEFIDESTYFLICKLILTNETNSNLNIISFINTLEKRVLRKND